jgi:hypothetical protein
VRLKHQCGVVRKGEGEQIFRSLCWDALAVCLRVVSSSGTPPPGGAYLCLHIFQQVTPKIFIGLNLAVTRSYETGYGCVLDEILQNIPTEGVMRRSFSPGDCCDGAVPGDDCAGIGGKDAQRQAELDVSGGACCKAVVGFSRPAGARGRFWARNPRVAPAHSRRLHPGLFSFRP